MPVSNRNKRNVTPVVLFKNKSHYYQLKQFPFDHPVVCERFLYEWVTPTNTLSYRYPLDTILANLKLGYANLLCVIM
jgi:hypothetical protein